MHRDSELIQYYLGVFLSMLSTPGGVMLLLAGLLAIGAAVSVPSSRWVFLTAALYMSTLPLIDAKSQYTVLAPGLQQLRQFGRPLIFFFLFLLLPTLFSSHRGWRTQFVSWALLLFLLFQVSIALRLSAFGGWTRGSLSMATYMLVFATLGYAVGRWMQTMEDLHKLIWVLSCACGLVVLATTYQILINRRSIMAGNRLTGVTANPQFFAIFIAYSLPLTCYLMARGTRSAWLRMLLIAQVAVTVVMLIWTGSRTGALSAAVGLGVTFHRQLGRFVVAGIVVSVAVLLIMPYFEGSSEVASRLIWAVNTRQEVFAQLINNIQQNFWFGASRDVFASQESTYLVVLGQFGIIGSLPFIFAAIFQIWQLYRLQRMRRYLGDQHRVLDAICGVWAALAVASTFEAILLGVITFPVLAMYILSAATTFVYDWCVTSAKTEAYEDYRTPLGLAAA